MQIKVKEARFLKEGIYGEGTAKEKKWKLYKVVAEDGTEYTTFDAKAAHLVPGTIIDIDSITIKDDKRSFKELLIVSAPNGKPDHNGSDMTKEEWALKQRIERASIETQTAVKAVLSIDTATMDQEAKLVYQKALKWCEAKIDANMAIPVSKAAEDPNIGRQFESVGKMFEKALAHGISRTDILTKYGIAEKDVPKISVEDMWAQIEVDFLKPDGGK